MKLDSLIHRLIQIEQKLGNIDVFINVEPNIPKEYTGFFQKEETFQFEDRLTDLATDGKRVILLGESFE